MIVLPSVQAGIVGSKRFVFDADAENYINRVIAADVIAGNSNGLEFTVKLAINNFILGLKEDSIWDKILSSCIMAGARTLAGAIVPLKDNINPTNVGLSTYNRKYGIRGPSSASQPGGVAPTIYLNTNIKNDGSYIIDGTTNNAGGIPQNDIHISAYTDGGSSGTSTSTGYIIGATSTSNNSDVALRPYSATTSVFRVHNNVGTIDTSTTNTAIVGFAGANRDSNGAIAYWTTANATPLYSTSITTASTNPTTLKDIYVFNRNDATSAGYINNYIKFFSIGKAIDMTKLNTRLNTLFNALNSLL